MSTAQSAQVVFELADEPSSLTKAGHKLRAEAETSGFFGIELRASKITAELGIGRQQVRFLRRQFLQEGDLPFTDVLSTEVVSQALTSAEVAWKDRIYPPLITLWVFLSQVLSEDHSCRTAVARLITHRLSRSQSSCSAETGADAANHIQQQ